MAKSISIETLLEKGLSDAEIKSLSFEQGLELLDELVKRVEGGSLPLEQSIGAYERGVALIDRLKEVLSGAEKKLKKLQKD